MSAREGATVRRGITLSPTGLTTFLVIDAILVLTFAVLLVLQLTGSPSGGPTAPAADATSATPTPSAEPETSPEPSAPTAPEANAGLTEFVMPSGNIWCSMTETSATCTIRSFSFTPPEAPPGCTGVVGPVLTVTAGEGASMPCIPEITPRPDAPVLEYGQASTIGEMTCYSSRNGATCRHNPTGEGFSVARAGYTFL
ncbi:MAG: hypothetical protein GX609_00200 [Actinomycetales bacterium]|jgi:hypothetical protein|nr:hypothetical protein [Actinomycetales bacterium]